MNENPQSSSASLRLPPHSDEAERGLLSCLLQDEKHLMAARADLPAEAFHHFANRRVYEVLLALADKNLPADVVTVSNALADARELDGVGGHAFISELYTFIPAPSHFRHYRQIVIRKWALRKFITVCADAIQAAHDCGKDEPDENPLPLIDEASAKIFEVQSQLMERGSHRGMMQIGPLVVEAVDAIESVIANRGHVTDGIATGFTDIDRMTMGLKPAQLMVVAARPGKGKSVWAGKICINVGIGLGDYKQFNQPPLPVGFFSLEMTGVEIVQRMLLSQARINLLRLRDGMVSRSDHESIAIAVAKLQKSLIHVESCYGLTIQSLRAKARQAVARYKLRLLVIDYLQLIGTSTRGAQGNRTAIIAEVSMGLKAMAGELKIPVICLAQLNREGEKPRPTMADLRESGQIEQDADIIGMLCDPPSQGGGDEDEEGSGLDDAGFVGFDLVKQRNGPTTTGGLPPLTLKFEREFFNMLSTTGDLYSGNDERRQK